MSFLISPPRADANNSARTYRSRPLHPRHIVPSLRSSLHCGEPVKGTVDSPNKPRFKDWLGSALLWIAKDNSNTRNDCKVRRESSENFEDDHRCESVDQGGCHGQSNRVLHSAELPETDEVGSGTTARKNSRASPTDKKVRLAWVFGGLA